MSETDTLALLREFLKKHSDQDSALVTLESPLSSVNIDSLMLLELIFEFEEKFGISVPNDFPTPDTVGELVGAVDALRARNTGAAN